MTDITDNKIGEAEVSTGLSRRDVMKRGAIAAATLAVPTILLNACARSMTEAPKDTYEADIVITETGFAGVFIAIEAIRNGKSTLVVDNSSVGWIEWVLADEQLLIAPRPSRAANSVPVLIRPSGALSR